MSKSLSAARCLAPEDVVVGSFVAVFARVAEYVSESCAVPARLEVQRLSYTPREPEGPLRVEAVCLPFVSVIDGRGKASVIDVRLAKLAAVDKRFAKAAWSAEEAERIKRKKRARRKRKRKKSKRKP